MKDDSPTDAARRIIAFNAMNGNTGNTSIDEVAVARAYLRVVEALEKVRDDYQFRRDHGDYVSLTIHEAVHAALAGREK